MITGGKEGNGTLNQSVHGHLKINLLINPVQNEQASIIRGSMCLRCSFIHTGSGEGRKERHPKWQVWLRSVSPSL